MFLKGFLLIAAVLLASLSAKDIGKYFKKLGLPEMSGYIITGILTGPFILNFMTVEAKPILSFIDLVALPFITFAAGAELMITEVKRRLKSIAYILMSIIVFCGTLGFIGFYFLSEGIPFLAGANHKTIIAVSLVGASVLPAKSCSSLIAVIRELRARGTMVQTALGVTVLMDAVVIILFAVANSIAKFLLSGSAFSFGEIFSLVLELGIDVFIGVLIGRVIAAFFSLEISHHFKIFFVLAIGFLVSKFGEMGLHITLMGLHLKIPAEPLLECMIAGITVANYTKHGNEFKELLEDASPVVFLFFFTALGASMDIDVLSTTWHVALCIVILRGIGMFTGCFIGARLVPQKIENSHLLGFAFITQAGISLSLAKAVATNYPEWGAQFATILISVIITNTIIGPTFTKWAFIFAGESHVKASSNTKGGGSVAIVGVDDQSLALYRQISTNKMNVKVFCTDSKKYQLYFKDIGEDIVLLPSTDREEVMSSSLDEFETIVLMLDDNSNYNLAEIAFEEFGTDEIIVRSSNTVDSAKFRELGALVVDPGSSIVGLLYQFVCTPSTAMLLFDQDEGKGVVEVRVTNRNVHGQALRDLSLPSDLLILGIRRKGQLLFSHGYTRIRLGDEISAVGEDESLEVLRASFGA